MRTMRKAEKIRFTELAEITWWYESWYDIINNAKYGATGVSAES